MKFLLNLVLFVTFLFSSSEKLIIDSENFQADDSRNLSIFTGDVRLKKVRDTLKSDKLEVHMKPRKNKKEKREPDKIIAIGNVKFEFFSKDKHYKGRGNKVIYNPNKKEYTIIGKAYLNEITQNRELFGEKIFINEETQVAKVDGTKKNPVRFILNIESKNKK